MAETIKNPFEDLFSSIGLNGKGAFSSASSSNNTYSTDDDCCDDCEYKKKYDNLSADYIRFKKRTEENEKQTKDSITESIVVKLLPVIDSIDQGIKYSEANLGLTALKGQLAQILNDYGVEEISPKVGEPFDIETSCAVRKEKFYHGSIYKTDDVWEVCRVGYRLNGKVIRPALVIVCDVAEEPAKETVSEDNSDSDVNSENEDSSGGDYSCCE